MHTIFTHLRTLAVGMSLLLIGTMSMSVLAQETTGAIQGTITDPAGAAVPNASVVASSPQLGTPASATTDSHGFYRLNALPPGTYVITVTGGGMKAKATNLQLSAGDLPNLNLKLIVGVETEINVTDSVALVDVTQSKIETVITKQEIDSLPKGRSFQSLLTLAPGVRQEPLQSLATLNGATAPNAAGNASVGGGSSRANGFQVDGASDAENIYLADGINITNIQGGGIGMNIPTEFSSAVSVKSGAIDAQYGGALGGVINVNPNRGTNRWHGGLLLKYQSSATDANDQCNYSTTCFLRLDPTTSSNSATRVDATAQYYIARQDHYRYVDPGFHVGGPLFSEKVQIFAGYLPDFARTRRDAVSTFSGNAGAHTYYNAADQHYAVLRLDYEPTSKLRLFAGWNYDFIRAVGQLPNPDSKLGQLNSSASTNPSSFRGDGGFVNPVAIYSFGGDYNIGSKTLISARYGYLFSNTHTLGTASGLRYSYSGSATPTTATLSGATIPTAFQNSNGFSNIAANQPTFFNTYTRKSFTIDLSQIVTGFVGTHAIKGGYSFVNTGNNVKMIYDYASVLLYYGQSYSPGTSPTACDAIIAANQAAYGVSSATKNCQGNYGYAIVRDGTDVLGSISSNAHGLYIQDDWSVAHTGLTINAGVRFDREYVPPYVAGDPSVTFGWGSKIAPRIGGAYDVLHNGKLKVFASYGKYFDILKFSLPQGSFGGNYWHDCVYTLDNPNFNLIQPTAPAGPDGFRHSCPVSGLAPGVGSNPATDTSGAGGNVGRFIENLDYRAVNNSADDPGVDPNLKPGSQHEIELGSQWAMTPSLSFNARYVRKRLDNTTEDMGLNDTYGYYIGNPGSAYGDLLHRALPNVYRAAANNLIPNATGFLNPTGICPQCPSTPRAIRNYDALEIRVEKRSAKWYGTAFYTYSRLTGNYPGLTSTFIADGSGGRHSPNNNRSFDIPQMQYTAYGKQFGGFLPTDRPHALTLFGSYRLKTFLGETSFGLQQVATSGSPVSTCMGLGGSSISACQFVEDQGGFVNYSRDASGNLVSSGVTHGRRTPAFTQTGVNLSHYIHASKEHENRLIGAEMNANNLFNQHAVMAYNPSPITAAATITTPSNAVNPTGTDYYTMMTGFDYTAVANGKLSNANQPKILSNQYGLPNTFQSARQVRFKLAYLF
ncbi:TonB-dependent receptor [Terriglobus saanensis]|uniref:TonB-dependent receptor plug n=1 Tax=Terriglobus saanensis (strain ATCC BAA-1853 / DSM 23119 / SP1PR4) TaxID=401053 RepID=E8V1C4_TERSS|nr:carboxypeptidase regulatory-like domain-containing protein [Terriglobus saanensis]ADV84539.1 TonB-dependent receptor plug [Terriglobus saanensis SP1PR4]